MPPLKLCWFSVWFLCYCMFYVPDVVLSIHILQLTAVLPPLRAKVKTWVMSPSKSAPLTFTPASPSCSQWDIPVMHWARGSNKCRCRWRLFLAGEAEVLSAAATVLSLKTALCGGHRQADCLGLYVTYYMCLLCSRTLTLPWYHFSK